VIEAGKNESLETPEAATVVAVAMEMLTILAA
jgi:hypothetical protein